MTARQTIATAVVLCLLNGSVGAADSCPKRWYQIQFSLRTLMLGMLGVSAGLGGVMWIKRNYDYEKAVNSIDNFGHLPLDTDPPVKQVVFDLVAEKRMREMAIIQSWRRDFPNETLLGLLAIHRSIVEKKGKPTPGWVKRLESKMDERKTFDSQDQRVLKKGIIDLLELHAAEGSEEKWTYTHLFRHFLLTGTHIEATRMGLMDKVPTHRSPAPIERSLGVLALEYSRSANSVKERETLAQSVLDLTGLEFESSRSRLLEVMDGFALGLSLAPPTHRVRENIDGTVEDIGEAVLIHWLNRSRNDHVNLTTRQVLDELSGKKRYDKKEN